jgi:cytidyltransferase-like protein
MGPESGIPLFCPNITGIAFAFYQVMKRALFLVLLLGFGLNAATSAAQASLCSAVFHVEGAQRNSDYLQASTWGTNLSEGLKSNLKKEVYLKDSQSAEERVSALKGLSIGDLVVAPGHKVLRVSTPGTAPVVSVGAKSVLLNAITDASGKVLFVDAWDGHHRILSSYQKGVQRLSELQAAGFEINILINGKPQGVSEPWIHFLPSAASNPSWESRIQFKSQKDVSVSGSHSNYEMGSRTTLAQLARNESHSRKSKIGIFFGTFDPVHENHIGVAKQALAEFGLDKVILVANALPAHKKPTPLGYRHALLKERIKNEKTLDVALFDTHYYIDNFSKEVLIEKIRQDVGSNNIYLIDGGDSFIKLLQLDQIQPTEVINYIVNMRGEDIRIPEKLKGKVFVSAKDLEGLSSSDIRKTFADGKIPETTKFTKASTDKIKSWGLYKTTEPSLYTSETLYSFMKSTAPIADLQFKGGEASKRYGLTYHHNDVWQMLLPATKKITDQVAFFKPDSEASRQSKNNLESEEAAYLLNRLLKMDIVPPTVMVKNIKAGGQVYDKGILSFAVMGAEKLMTPERLNNSLEEQLFFSDARILNVLLQNKDANDRNYLVGRHWHTGKQERFIIDFSQSKQKNDYLAMNYYPVGHTAEIKVFRNSTVEALKALDAATLKKDLSHIYSEAEIADILRIRDGVLAYIEGLLKTAKAPLLY